MADRKKNNGRKRSRRKARNRKNTRPRALIIDALAHTTRREILRRMHADGTGEYSPTELGELLVLPTPTVDYHIQIMVKRAAIKLLKEEKIRGATKYTYGTVVADHPTINEILVFTKDEDKEEEAERRQEEAEKAEEALSENGHSS